MNKTCGAGWNPAADCQSARCHKFALTYKEGRLTIGARIPSCPTLAHGCDDARPQRVKIGSVPGDFGLYG